MDTIKFQRKKPKIELLPCPHEPKIKCDQINCHVCKVAVYWLIGRQLSFDEKVLIAKTWTGSS